MEKKFKAIVVSHTHWDRAWYWPFQQYRIRLVQTFDQIIDILKTKEDYKSFTFDGQTIILEDYLEIKPENYDIIKKLVGEKRLIIGPWYVLPDEFIVSGESLIRNLMLGHRIAESFGAVMKEGYVPDPFGHISQLPQILNGFGIDSFIFTRGVTKEIKDFGTEFLWESADGSKVLAVNQRNNYCHMASWGFKTVWEDYRLKEPDMNSALDRVRKEFKSLSNVSNTNVLLFTNGCDHLPPQPQVPEMINFVNQKLDDLELIHGTFTDYFKFVRESNPALKTYSGELTGSEFSVILLGVYSARMYLKQMNHFSQNLFEKYTEPISAFSRLEGGEDYSGFIWNGWKLILKNHPHDDICGSGIDEIHSDMVNRFAQANQIGVYIINNCFADFAKNINTAQRDGNPIVVYNPNNWMVTDILEFDILLSPDDPLIKKFQIVDSENIPVRFKILGSNEIHKMELFKEATYHAFRIKLLCENIPPCGYKTLYITQPEKNYKFTKIKNSKDNIENEFFIVKALQNGTLEIFDKRSGVVYKNCNLFEDTEDIGDEYTYSYARFGKTVYSKNSKAKIELIDESPVSATLKISINLKVPAEILKNRQRRCNEFVTIPIISLVRVCFGVERIDIVTEVDNKAKDHRLRVLFPSGIISSKCFADGHFGIITRDSYFDKKPSFNNRFEFYSTKHQKAFVSVSDDNRGLTISNKGLPEYEVLSQNGAAVIALTLFRSVGWLSRGDLITRPVNAGPVLETPDAQCLGKNIFEYSIIPHTSNWKESKVYKLAYQYNSPLMGFNVKKSNGSLNHDLSFLKVEPDSIIVSCIKLSEDGHNLVIRFYNIENKAIKAYINVYKHFKNAYFTNLNEEIISKLVINDQNQIEFQVDPNKIITILFEF